MDKQIKELEIFYLFTNLAVWGVSGLYEKSLKGLLECYILAIPFFFNTLCASKKKLFTLLI